MAPAFHVENFGCRAAQADGAAVSDRLRASGLDEQAPAIADVVVINTCSVTAEADRAARAYIRRTHRQNPAARIVVTGCYAQRAPDELARIEGVAAIIGNSHKALAPEIILGLLERAGRGLIHIKPATDIARAASEQLTAPQGHSVVLVESLLGAQAQLAPPQGHSAVLVESLLGAQAQLAPPQVAWVDDRFAHSFLEEAQLEPGAQTRPNLKIQEGCGNRCSFCVIPSTRGPSKSLPAPSILKQVEGFVAAGGNELVLSGINLGRWGRDLSGAAVHTLAGLVRTIFEQSALPRLRLSSIEPMDWEAELIGLMAEFGGTLLARHAHLPLQSGSDAVLRRMHRRYRPWHYADKVDALLRAVGPELTLGADVMVGFPGETDAEFEETVALVRALPFGYLHLFPFSPRPATKAWALHAELPVPAEAVKERMTALRTLAAEKCETHRRCLIGCEVEAITLHTSPELAARESTTALTENFLPVEMKGQLPANRLVRVRVTGLTADGTLEAVQYCAAATSV